ncbi:MAG: hypothetical protein JSU83_17000 [Deltaproteobacteria bacterium]|nr:MAG: hypothetical protein JSU83_17000 [Deltaproteobacteria bacterium]
MVTSQTRRKIFTLFVALGIILACGPVMAIPVTLPSGKVVDLSARQVELLKKSPGIYYFDHRSEKIINQRVRYWVLIDLPEALGGGFLIGTPQNLAQGFKMTGVDETPDTGIIPPKMSAETSNSTVGIAPAGPGKTEKAFNQNDWRWSFDIGYRIDDFDWSIAGPAPPAFGGNYVNVLSELTWSDLEIFQLELGFEKTFPNKITLKGSVAYGLIFDGENQDSDYAGNNRTLEFSRSNNSADGGDTWDGSIGLGYYFPFLSDTFRITPLIGYSFHIQNLSITDGFQTIPPVGPFPGLNSTYETLWYGPWGGLEMKVRKYKKNGASLAHEIIFGIEYHWVEYDAEANWNLRTDFAHPVSFEHEADGYGVVFSAGFNYFFHTQWSLDFSGKYQKWKTDLGIDRVFFADGTQAETPLNEVDWKSFSIMVGVSCRF